MTSAVAARHEDLDLAHDLVGRAVDLGPARPRHHAEAADVVAALHHRDVGAHRVAWATRSSGIAKASALRSRSTLTWPVAAACVEQLGDAREVVGADEDVDVRRALEDLVSLELGDAAADADPQVRAAAALSCRSRPSAW